MTHHPSMGSASYHAGDGSYSKSDAEIAAAIVRSEQAGCAYRTPLLRANLYRAISLAIVSGGRRVPQHFLNHERPCVVLLTDDTPDATGPGRWKQAAVLIRWARGAIFHAAEGQADQYSTAVAGALITRRFLIVEMESRHHAEWLALATRVAPRLPVLNIVPPPGKSHPDYSRARPADGRTH